MEREQTDSRWSGFSDEELQELRNGMIERHETRALPTEIRARAGRLSSELRRELTRREREQDGLSGFQRLLVTMVLDSAIRGRAYPMTDDERRALTGARNEIANVHVEGS